MLQGSPIKESSLLGSLCCAFRLLDHPELDAQLIAACQSWLRVFPRSICWELLFVLHRNLARDSDSFCERLSLWTEMVCCLSVTTVTQQPLEFIEWLKMGPIRHPIDAKVLVEWNRLCHTYPEQGPFTREFLACWKDFLWGLRVRDTSAQMAQVICDLDRQTKGCIISVPDDSRIQFLEIHVDIVHSLSALVSQGTDSVESRQLLNSLYTRTRDALLELKSKSKKVPTLLLMLESQEPKKSRTNVRATSRKKINTRPTY